MEALADYINYLPNLWGIFALMLSSFLIGYFVASAQQRNKFRSIIERLKREVNALKVSPKKNTNDIETIFTEIEPKIIEVVKQQQQKYNDDELEESRANSPSFAEKNRARYLKEMAQAEKEDEEVRELDFDSFGYADESDKEDLTQINGIGPYIEQKLNDIGIYNYEQISKLSKTDVEIITEMIDFFPDRIDRDNWVGQARALNFKV
ncbi:MAG: hypothetical protein R3359_07815 [Marinirhabdus sp.]|nr:hypothetical protein [Marinirhabdus sp.]